MYFKNHNGSLLLEALFALCISGILLSALFNGIGSLITHISFYNQELIACLEAKNNLEKIMYTEMINNSNHDTEDEKTKKSSNLEEKTDDMKNYIKATVNQKSIFANNKYLKHATMKYEWTSPFKDGSDRLVTFIFEIPQKGQK